VKNYPEPHGFLDKKCIDFEGLEILSGKNIFYRIAEWINERNCSHLVPAFQIETVAFLYHIVFGCNEKIKTITNNHEQEVWKNILKMKTNMAFRSWKQMWQIVAENSVQHCGKSAADEICLLFPEYMRALLISTNKNRKSKFYVELSDLPDWREDIS